MDFAQMILTIRFGGELSTKLWRSSRHHKKRIWGCFFLPPMVRLIFNGLDGLDCVNWL